MGQLRLFTAQSAPRLRCHCSPQGPFPQFPGHLLWVTFCAATAILGLSVCTLSKAAISRIIFLACDLKMELDEKQNLSHAATVVSSCFLQQPQGLSTAMKSWIYPTAVTLAKSYRICSMCSLQKLTCPQNRLKLQLTRFMEFTPSAVGKTQLMHFLALRLKNKMSPTGQILLWQRPESAQGCGCRPGSHRMFITPLYVEQSPLTCLPSPHPQTSLCSCLCGSEGGMEMHKVIPEAALSKRKPKKCHGEKSFLLQTWG